MNTKPNGSSENSYKNTNTQHVQTNALAEECFETQSKNDLIVENSLYKDNTTY